MFCHLDPFSESELSTSKRRESAGRYTILIQRTFAARLWGEVGILLASQVKEISMALLKASSLRKRPSIFGFLVVLACLLAGTRANAQGDELLDAASKGDLDRVEKLLTMGTDVNARSSAGGTALYGASFNGHLDVVQALLAKGADVDGTTLSRSRPLAAASQQGHLDVVQLLLAKGADVNALNLDGLSALFLASQQGHLDVVQLLLAKGADVNAKTSLGFTPLYAAKRGGHRDVYELLSRTLRSQAGVHPGGTGESSHNGSTNGGAISPAPTSVPLPPKLTFPLKPGEWAASTDSVAYTQGSGEVGKSKKELYCLTDETWDIQVTQTIIPEVFPKEGTCPNKISTSATGANVDTDCMMPYEMSAKVQNDESGLRDIYTYFGWQIKGNFQIVFDGTIHMVGKGSINATFGTFTVVRGKYRLMGAYESPEGAVFSPISGNASIPIINGKGGTTNLFANSGASFQTDLRWIGDTCGKKDEKLKIK